MPCRQSFRHYLSPSSTLIFFLLVFPTSGQPENMFRSTLKINEPLTLSKANGFAHRDAFLGIPSYNEAIEEYLYYVDTSFCSSEPNHATYYPFQNNSHNSAPNPRFILMIDRGGCDFQEKVLNAQNVGASAVLIADTDCLCSDVNCIREGKQCQDQWPAAMADTAQNDEIVIPSFLMLKSDADNLKHELKKNVAINVSMSWSVPESRDGTSTYEFWPYSSADTGTSMGFTEYFRDMAVSLGHSASFTPHAHICNGQEYVCPGKQENAPLCTANNRYCLQDDTGLTEFGISGVAAIEESLRRLCIWKAYGSSDGIGREWWDYVSYHSQHCTRHKFTNADCISTAYEIANIDGSQIKSCMDDSGGVSGNGPNYILENALKESESFSTSWQFANSGGIMFYPAVLVNGLTIPGEFSARNTFAALCATFPEEEKPHICSACASCIPRSLECVRNDGICPEEDTENTGKQVVLPAGNSGKSSSGREIEIIFLIYYLLGALGYVIFLAYKFGKSQLNKDSTYVATEEEPEDVDL